VQPKIRFSGGPPVEHEDIMRNVAHARTLGLPFVQSVAPHGRPLAIVGGGPSVQEHVLELRNFEGDIWGINGACGWLRERGIESTFISVDPHAIVAQWTPGARKALLGTRTDPQVFEILKGADVTLFELEQEDAENGMRCGSSTASLAFDLGTELGYRTAIFYGCEGSWPAANPGDPTTHATHAYPEPSQQRAERMVIACGGREYLTAPDFYVQSCELSDVIRMFPTHFSERSGGLLRAFVENDDHEIAQVSRAMYRELYTMNKEVVRPLEEAA
jgi:hypothetical protein